MDENKSYKSLALLTSAWYGDDPLTIYFPGNWGVVLVEQPDHEALDDSEIAERIRNPIGTRLSELAVGKRQVAILVDDIQRPTPLSRILPFVLKELQKAGIQREGVTVVMATACHRQATREDFIKKLGEEVFRAVRTLPHDCRNGLTYIGETSRGTPIHVNAFVAGSDLKIGICGVYPHESAGFGGGSKIVHPGVCGIQTIRHLHSNLKGGTRGSSLDSDFRTDIEEAAEKVGLDFSINVLINKRREIAHLSCGHRVHAHREAARVAPRFYGVTPVDDADVIVTNTYPFDTSIHLVQKGLWPLSYGEKGTSNVIIASCPEVLGYHALSLKSLEGITGVLQRMRALSRHDMYRLIPRQRRREKELLFCSPSLTEKHVTRFYPKARVFSSWELLLRKLESEYRGRNVKVAVYQCSPLQFPLES